MCVEASWRNLADVVLHVRSTAGKIPIISIVELGDRISHLESALPGIRLLRQIRRRRQIPANHSFASCLLFFFFLLKVVLVVTLHVFRALLPLQHGLPIPLLYFRPVPLYVAMSKLFAARRGPFSKPPRNWRSL